MNTRRIVMNKQESKENARPLSEDELDSVAGGALLNDGMIMDKYTALQSATDSVTNNLSCTLKELKKRTG
jgi:hypothetical protein